MNTFRPRTTWDIVWDDFKDRFPNLTTKVIKHRPHGYMTITLWLIDGERFTYNMETRALKAIRD